MRRITARIVVGLAAAAGFWVQPAGAQSLNIEGQTGGAVTPFAMVSPAEGNRVHLVAGFSFLNMGETAGNRFQITLGGDVGGRVEFGYTKAGVVSGTADDISHLFDRGFQNIHGKAIVFRPAAAGHLPSIAVGGRVRWNREELYQPTPMRNGDAYVVATESLPLGSGTSLLLSGGLKWTNASLFGFTGTATGWTTRAFAAAAADVRSRVLVGAEWVQQPGAFEGLPESELPSTLSLFAHVSPLAGRLTVTMALVRFAGEIATAPATLPWLASVDVKATHTVVVGAGVRF